MRTIDPTSSSLAERENRRPPGSGDEAASELGLRTLRSFGPMHLIAPNNPDRATDLNTLILSTWVEIQLFTEDGKPIRNELCHLYRVDGAILEAWTDADGVARWSDLPSFCDDLKQADAMFLPALVLPNVLEEFREDPPGRFGKDKGARSGHCRYDGSVRFIPVNQEKVPIHLFALTPEEKFQTFRRAYEDHNAKYGGAAPREYDSKQNQWRWGGGAVCNQHVNFFLGYWFNYNKHFTTAASRTAMIALVMFDSEKQKYLAVDEVDGVPTKTLVSHRGYEEFIEPVTGFSTAHRTNREEFPSPLSYNQAVYYAEYINIAQYFTAEGTPRAAGRQLIAALADFNVYSVADLNKKSLRSSTAAKIRGWLQKQPKGSSYAALASWVKAKTDNQVLEHIWELEPTEHRELFSYITSAADLNFDHHCGLLLRRGPDNTSAAGVDADQIELWTFSADGSPSNKKAIKMKPFSDYFTQIDRQKLMHLAIWKLKPLRPGGFAPFVGCSPELDLDAPPRFIRWGK